MKTEFKCRVCGATSWVYPSVARKRKTCGRRGCHSEWRRQHRVRQSGDMRDRLMAKVVVTPSGCWEWQGSKDKHGYGVMVTGKSPFRAHRVSYVLHKGPLPPEAVVCHNCDNPGCVNPDHLYSGTHKTNGEDRVSRSRSARGERNGRAKLTEREVVIIRRRAANGKITRRKLAEDFGVSQTLIFHIIHRTVWRHLE